MTKSPAWKRVLYDWPHARGLFPIVMDGMTIGRALDNHLPLDDEYISRHHARLHLRAGALLIEDLGSVNGVIVNGERIRNLHPLQPRDSIELGPFRFQVETASAPIKPIAHLTQQNRRPLIAGLVLLLMLVSLLVGGLLLGQPVSLDYSSLVYE